MLKKHQQHNCLHAQPIVVEKTSSMSITILFKKKNSTPDLGDKNEKFYHKIYDDGAKLVA